MKSISNAFLTMLQSSAQLVEADLYEFALASGTTLYYTSAQENVVYNGNTYIAANTAGPGAILSNPSFSQNTSNTPRYTSLATNANASDDWSVGGLSTGYEVMLEAEDVLIRLLGGTSVPANSAIVGNVGSKTYTVIPGAPFQLWVYGSATSNVGLPSGITVGLNTIINWYTAAGAFISTTEQSIKGDSYSENIFPYVTSGNAPATAFFAQVVIQASCSNTNSSATTVGSGGQLPADLRWYSVQLTQYSTPGFKRGQTRCTRGLDTDELEIEIEYDSNTQILGETPAAFANAGGFDGAIVTVYKALAPSWANPVVNGAVNLFTGVVGEIKSDSAKVSMTVSSMLIYLQTNFPRNYFLPQCNHALFDGGCGLSKAAYAVSGTVSTTSGASTTTTFNSNCTQAANWFALGYIVWNTGANAGVVSSVKAYSNTNGAFQLIYPLTSPPANGDTFAAYPGCDKTLTTCKTKFNNATNNRSFPFVPTPETLEVGGTGSTPITQDGGGGGAGMQSLARGPGGLSGNFTQS